MSRKMLKIVPLICFLLCSNYITASEIVTQPLEEGQSKSNEGQNQEKVITEVSSEASESISSEEPTRPASEKSEDVTDIPTKTETEATTVTESAITNVLESTESETEVIREENKVSSTLETKSSLATEQPKAIESKGHFSVHDTKGNACLLANFKATFDIDYQSKGGKQSISLDLPDKVKTKGKCGEDVKTPELHLSWDKFSFIITFSEITNEEETKDWAVTSMEFRYNTGASQFDRATNVGKKTVRTKNNIEFFKTAYGKSYYCASSSSVHLYASPDVSSKKVVTIKLRDVRMQPFAIVDGAYSDAVKCPEMSESAEVPFVRDETVPLAVGLTLTILTLLVLLGFTIHRAYMMRKVDYNSME